MKTREFLLLCEHNEVVQQGVEPMMLLRLPEGDADYSIRVMLLKR